MIKKITIKNYRCLKYVELKIEKDLTVIVGENDCGKSSIISAMKLIFQNSMPEFEDFHNGTDEILIELKMDDKTLIKKYNISDDNQIILELGIKIAPLTIETIKEQLESSEFNSISENEKKELLFKIASEIGLNPRSNTSSPTLITKILAQIEELENNKYYLVPDSLPEYNAIFLDGTKFNDINNTFKLAHFKKIKNKIWAEKLENDQTIEELIQTKLNSYSTDLQEGIVEDGFVEKLKEYLPELSGIKIIPKFIPSDINVGVNVVFLDGQNEIFVNKKGDGTKRRITMALLEYPKKNDNDEASFYIFDEPDTHLHVKAQVEFLEIMKNFNELNRQVIITTHSPFLMNSVKPQQIRLLSLDNHSTKIQQLHSDENVLWTLKLLGISNTNLFFSNKIFIVEGESEEIFVKIVYERFFGNNIHSDLVKVVKREGIEDVPRFTEVLTQFVQPKDSYILIDNDGDDETEELISNLELSNENIVKIGLKEFEDSFESKVIHECWKKFVEDKGRTIGPEWTIEKIEEMKVYCKDNNAKFSKKLRALNQGSGVKMKKPILAKALAENIGQNDLDTELYRLLSTLRL